MTSRPEARADDQFQGSDGKDTFVGGGGPTRSLCEGGRPLRREGGPVAGNCDGHLRKTDTLKAIENVVGTSRNDALVGSSGNNSLSGGSGNDVFVAGAGTDTIDGGGGLDTLTIRGKASDWLLAGTSTTTDRNGAVHTTEDYFNLKTGDEIIVTDVEKILDQDKNELSKTTAIRATGQILNSKWVYFVWRG